MNIRQAAVCDLDGILGIYERARRFMAETGNPTQWEGGYPSRELLLSDIAGGHLYVLTEGDALYGVFAFFPEGDPAYDALSDHWCNALPYATIHRVASAGTRGGVLSAIVSYCLARNANLKIDTHKDNRVMQGALLKLGFTPCGSADIPGVGERILYQLYKEEAR